MSSRLADDHHLFALWAFLGQQRQDGAVQRDERSFSVEDKPEKVGVGNLLMPPEPSGERCYGLLNGKDILPKAVRRMSQVRPQQGQCIGRRERARGKGGVRENTYKRALGERARRPTLLRVTG